jgi:hypothetical protein
MVLQGRYGQRWDQRHSAHNIMSSGFFNGVAATSNVNLCQQYFEVLHSWLSPPRGNANASFLIIGVVLNAHMSTLQATRKKRSPAVCRHRNPGSWKGGCVQTTKSPPAPQANLVRVPRALVQNWQRASPPESDRIKVQIQR